jgi:hypothetical protein
LDRIAELAESGLAQKISPLPGVGLVSISRGKTPAAGTNTNPAVLVSIQRKADANTTEVIDRIKALLPQLQAALPPAVRVSILTDGATTVPAPAEASTRSATQRATAPATWPAAFVPHFEFTLPWGGYPGMEVQFLRRYENAGPIGTIESLPAGGAMPDSHP